MRYLLLTNLRSSTFLLYNIVSCENGKWTFTLFCSHFSCLHIAQTRWCTMFFINILHKFKITHICILTYNNYKKNNLLALWISSDLWIYFLEHIMKSSKEPNDFLNFINQNHLWNICLRKIETLNFISVVFNLIIFWDINCSYLKPIL